MIGGLFVTPETDPADLQRLRLQLQQISARVERRLIDQGQLLLIDLGRGRQADAEQRLQQLQPLAQSINSVPAIAPTVTTAVLAALQARSGTPLTVTPATLRDLLAACPLDWLPACRPYLSVLQGLGLRHLADLADLPASAVTLRFDGALLTQWRALHGDEPPFQPLPLPPRLYVRRRLDGPVSDGLILSAALHSLAMTLGRTLEQRGMQARSLLLELHGDGIWSAARVLEQPACGTALAHSCSGLLTCAAPTAGVDRLVLHAAELVPWQPEQLTLLAAAVVQQRHARQVVADLALRCAPDVVLQLHAQPAGLQPAEQRLQPRAWRVS